MNKRNLIHKKLIMMAFMGTLLSLLAWSTPICSGQVPEEYVPEVISVDDGKISAGQIDESKGPAAAPGKATFISTTEPGRATLISPKGTIGSFAPTFSWNPGADSIRYCLKINGPSGYNFNQWFDAEEVTTDTGCMLVSPDGLVPGDYTWQVRTGNFIEDGPWSAVMRFKVTDRAPAKASTISPKGLISTRTPIFTWSALPGSTQYHLWVENNDTETVIDEWFPAEKVTYGYRCAVLSPMILPDDDVVYYWRVQGSNDIGDGPWSSFKYFEIVCGAPGMAKGQKTRDGKGNEGKVKEQAA